MANASHPYPQGESGPAMFACWRARIYVCCILAIGHYYHTFSVHKISRLYDSSSRPGQCTSVGRHKFEADQPVGKWNLRRLRAKWITGLNTAIPHRQIGSADSNKKDVKFRVRHKQGTYCYLAVYPIPVLLHTGPHNHSICRELKVHALCGFLIGSTLEAPRSRLSPVKCSAGVEISVRLTV